MPTDFTDDLQRIAAALNRARAALERFTPGEIASTAKAGSYWVMPADTPFRMRWIPCWFTKMWRQIFCRAWSLSWS